MSEPGDDINDQDASDASDTASATVPETAADMSAPAGGAPEVHPAEFPEAARRTSGTRSSLDISVEIGRVTMNIGEMLQLGEGSVVELERELTEPVAVMAQGVRIASGEVVVINDRFAVRITEVADTSDGATMGGAA